MSSSTPSESSFLKMEDLHTSASPAPSQAESSPAPNTVYVQSKPAKKRKSWGQELPQPKTNLPPRKRAKTDDEKEQRRIERIKRNRAAAHNSRERKRQETETLAVALAKANAELDAYRKLHGPLPASIVLPDVQLSVDSSDNITTTAVTPAPSLVESHGSQGDASSPKSPDDDIFQHNIKQEPQEHSFPILPPAYETFDSKSAFLPLDQTQHSAAMLCDLQCRSSRKNSNSTSPASWWANLILFLMSSQLQTCYRTLLVALWTLSPSRMARMMQASMARSSRLTTSSMTPRLLRSTPRRLARHNAATGLRAPRKGALAHLRQSLERGRTLRDKPAETQAQTHQTHLALGEPVRKVEDQPMGGVVDQEDSSNGVRRSSSLD